MQDNLWDILFGGRKKSSGRAPKKGRRLSIEHVEPRRMLSATMTGGGGPGNLCDVTNVALLAGANQYSPSVISGDSLSASPVAPSLTATAVSNWRSIWPGAA